MRGERLHGRFLGTPGAGHLRRHVGHAPAPGDLGLGEQPLQPGIAAAPALVVLDVDAEAEARAGQDGTAEGLHGACEVDSPGCLLPVGHESSPTGNSTRPLAGFPATREPAGMSRVTAEPTLILVALPTRRPGVTSAPEPRKTAEPRVTLPLTAE